MQYLKTQVCVSSTINSWPMEARPTATMPHNTHDGSVAGPVPDSDEFKLLIKRMLDGYGALLDELNRLTRMTSTLERRLDWAHKEVCADASTSLRTPPLCVMNPV